GVGRADLSRLVLGQQRGPQRSHGARRRRQDQAHDPDHRFRSDQRIPRQAASRRHHRQGGGECWIGRRPAHRAACRACGEIVNWLPSDTTTGGFMSKGTVLIVGSNATRIEVQGGGTGATGQYLNETVVPAMAFVDAGYDVVLATPNGTKPYIDPVSDAPQHFGGDEPAYQRATAFLA